MYHDSAQAPFACLYHRLIDVHVIWLTLCGSVNTAIMWTPEHLTESQKEERRLSAVPLLSRDDLSKSEIARQLGVSRQIVSRWAQQLRSDGEFALRRRAHTGRPSYLSAEQWQEVLSVLRAGGQAFGFDTDRWTLTRIAEVIYRKFGVRYNANYLSQQLDALGWSVQVPEVTARERDEALVAAWLRGDWPRILKKRAAWAHKLPL